MVLTGDNPLNFCLLAVSQAGSLLSELVELIIYQCHNLFAV